VILPSVKGAGAIFTDLSASITSLRFWIPERSQAARPFFAMAEYGVGFKIAKPICACDEGIVKIGATMRE
jgi:hypothetical protein